jgi:radical SAM superfamily enzyme YgiQ (UPF0313 family)
MLKDIRAEHIPVVNKKLMDADIDPVYSFMAGLPGETPEQVEMTLDLMIRLKEENPNAKLYKLALYVPFPGTTYFERVRQMGQVYPDNLVDWGDYDYDHVNLTYLTDELRSYLEKVAELSAFIDVEGKIGGVLAPVARAYSKVAIRRCKKRRFKFVPEMAAIKLARSLQRV